MRRGAPARSGLNLPLTIFIAGDWLMSIEAMAGPGITPFFRTSV
jgi:hypothetical protein